MPRRPGAAEVERRTARLHRLGAAHHPRRLAEHDLEREIDRRLRRCERVGDDQPSVRRRGPEPGPRRALARTQRRELVDPLGSDREDVALLRLVAPQLERRQIGLAGRDRAQLEPRAEPGVVHELGQRVRQPAGADVVDRQDGVGVAQRPAAIDHLLTAPLDLGVVALDRREVEILGRRTLGERRCRATAQADQERRAAEHDQRRARRDRRLGDVSGAHRADAAGEHHRLVIAARHPPPAGLRSLTRRLAGSSSNVRK